MNLIYFSFIVQVYRQEVVSKETVVLRRLGREGEGRGTKRWGGKRRLGRGTNANKCFYQLI